MKKGKFGLKLYSLLYLQIITMFITRFIQNNFEMKSIVYINDIVTLSILGLFIIQSKWKIKRDITILIIFEIIIWFVSFWFGKGDSIVGFIYQFRMLARFFVVFIVAKETWNEKDYTKLFWMFDIAFAIHFILSMIQLIFVNVEERDAIGGIFGISYGYGNGAGHLLLIVVTIITVYKYLERQEPIIYSGIKLILAVVLASNTEVKSFIFEAAMISVIMIVMQKKIDCRVIALLVCGVAIGLWMTSFYIQKYDFDLGDIKGVSDYLNAGYGFNQEGIGRTNGFQVISKNCFKGKVSHIIWGFGFASAGSEYTKMRFGNMNLEYFTYAQLFYEVGVIGLLLYLAPFVLGIKKSISLIKSGVNLGKIALCVSIMGIYWSFYSNIMQADVGGYIFYLLLGIAYLRVKKTSKDILHDTDNSQDLENLLQMELKC